MPDRQKIFFLTIAVALLIVIVELVRRRRLRVEYSWLWLASGLTIVVLILRYDLLIWLTGLVGAVVPIVPYLLASTARVALAGSIDLSPALLFSVTGTVATRVPSFTI